MGTNDDDHTAVHPSSGTPHSEMVPHHLGTAAGAPASAPNYGATGSTHDIHRGSCDMDQFCVGTPDGITPIKPQNPTRAATTSSHASSSAHDSRNNSAVFIGASGGAALKSDRGFADESFVSVSGGTALGGMLELAPGATVVSMLLDILRNFIPAAAVNCLYFCNQTVTMMFVGQTLGVDLLAHYSVGLSVYNSFGIAICVGIATSLDTLASQCYGRNSKGPELGELLQLTILVCMACAVPILLFFWFSEPVMVLFFGQDMGRGVAVFLKMAPFYLIFQVLAVCLQKTLQGQRVGQVPLYAAVVSAVMCPVYNYFLTHRGLHGAVASITLCSMTLFLSMVVLSRFNDKVIIGQASWPLRREAVTWVRVKEIFVNGLPAAGMLAAEWWSFEVAITFAAVFGPAAVDAFTIAFNLLLVFFSILQGLGTAIAVLAGNSLGAGCSRGARTYALLGATLGFTVASFDLFIITFLSDRIFGFYTNDGPVLHYLSEMRWVLLVYHFGDAGACAFQGIFRGVGRQNAAARCVLIALWGVGVPAAYFCSKTMEMGITGVLLGYALGIGSEGPLMMIDWWRNWDWRELMIAARRGDAHDAAHPDEAPVHDMEMNEHDRLLGNFEVGGLAIPA